MFWVLLCSVVWVLLKLKCCIVFVSVLVCWVGSRLMMVELCCFYSVSVWLLVWLSRVLSLLMRLVVLVGVVVLLVVLGGGLVVCVVDRGCFRFIRCCSVCGRSGLVYRVCVFWCRVCLCSIGVLKVFSSMIWCVCGGFVLVRCDSNVVFFMLGRI